MGIRHELTHWKWLDPMAVLVRDAVRILYYFHPAAWFAGKRLVEALECACDRAMLENSKDAEAYAERLYYLLIKMRQEQGVMVSGGLFASRTQVGRRIEALLRCGQGLRPQLTWMSGGALVIATIVVLLLGGAVGQNGEPGLSPRYETAPSAGPDHTHRVGPNTFQVREVRAVDSAVVIALSPSSDLYDVIELRIFDHATRDFLGGIREDTVQEVHRRLAFELTGDGLRIESLGEPLPTAVDIWVRVHSYDSPDVATMESGPGHSVQIGGAKVLIVQMMAGAKPYRTRQSETGKTVVDWGGDDQRIGEDVSTTIQFQNREEPLIGRYQVCAVDHAGGKYWPSLPHFLDFEKSGGTEVVTFPISGPDFSHLEWRPFGGRHRFFFENVKLPTVVAGEGDPVKRLAGIWVDRSYSPTHWHRFTEDGRHLFVSEGDLGDLLIEDAPLDAVKQADGSLVHHIRLNRNHYEIRWKTRDELLLRRTGRGDVVKGFFRAGVRGIAAPPPLIASLLNEALTEDDRMALRLVGTWIGGGALMPIWHRFHPDGTYVSAHYGEPGKVTRSVARWEVVDGELSRGVQRQQVTWSDEDSFVVSEGDGKFTFNRHVPKEVGPGERRILRALANKQQDPPVPKGNAAAADGRVPTGPAAPAAKKESFLKRIFRKTDGRDQADRTPQATLKLRCHKPRLQQKDLYRSWVRNRKRRASVSKRSIQATIFLNMLGYYSPRGLSISQRKSIARI